MDRSYEVAMQTFKAEACTIAGIPERFWPYINVRSLETTANATLVLLHYNDEWQQPRLKHLKSVDSSLQSFEDRDVADPEIHVLEACRGIIIDVTFKVVLVRTHGYNAVQRLEISLEYDNEGALVVHQKKFSLRYGHLGFLPHGYNSNYAVSLHPGYDGPYITIFKYDGTIFVATHRQIDGSNSRRGSNMTFFEMYEDIITANGPKLSELFDEKVRYSAFVHQFLIVHKKMRINTSTTGSQVIHLRTIVADPHPRHSEGEVAIEMVYDRPLNWKERDGLTRERFTQQVTFTLDNANKYMFPQDFATKIDPNEAQGLESNELILECADNYQVVDIKINRETKPRHYIDGGDYVIMYHHNLLTGNIDRVDRLEPPSYATRSNVTGNNPNPYNRFVANLHHYRNPNPEENIAAMRFRQNQLFVKDYLDTTAQRGQKGPRGRAAAGVNSVRAADQRMELWRDLLEASYAPDFRPEIRKFSETLIQDIEMTAGFLINDYPKLKQHDAVNKLGVQYIDLIEETLAKIQETQEQDRGRQKGQQRQYAAKTNLDYARMVLLNQTLGADLNKLFNLSRRSKTSPEIKKILDPWSVVPDVGSIYEFPPPGPVVQDTQVQQQEELKELLASAQQSPIINLWGQPSTGGSVPAVDINLFTPDV